MDVIEIAIPSRVRVNERLKKLIDKYGKDKVAEVIGVYFEYELLREIGDVYRDAIILEDMDLDAIEEELGSQTS